MIIKLKNHFLEHGFSYFMQSDNKILIDDLENIETWIYAIFGAFEDLKLQVDSDDNSASEVFKDYDDVEKLKKAINNFMKIKKLTQD